MPSVLRALQPTALHALLILGFARLIAPGETVAADVTPAEWLRRQIPPQFEVGHTLPPLTRWGWSMDMATRKELAEHWGYAVEFGGYVSKEIADAALQDPKSDNGQCLALVAQDPKIYKLGVLLERAFPSNPPPAAIPN